MANIVDNSQAVDINVIVPYLSFDSPNFTHGPTGDTYLTPSGTSIGINSITRNAASYVYQTGTYSQWDLFFKMNLSTFTLNAAGGGSFFIGPMWRRSYTPGKNYPGTGGGVPLLYCQFRCLYTLQKVKLLNTQFSWPGNGAGPGGTADINSENMTNVDLYYHIYRTVNLATPSSKFGIGIYLDSDYTQPAYPSVFATESWREMDVFLADGVTPDTGSYGYFLMVGGANPMTDNPGYVTKGTISECHLY